MRGHGHHGRHDRLHDQITYIHPCRGVRIPTVPATVRTIVTPEQFDVIYDALPDADRILTVSRKVVEVNRKFHSDGRRFLVKDYPKDKEYRGSSSGRRSSRSSERNAGS